jgi:hypothetical protein
MAEQRIETTININAPPKRVWSILTDWEAMSSWNPFIRSISGELKPGARLSVHIAPPGKRGMRFNPTVVTVQPESELRWLGQFLLPGILDGEHYFRLENLGNGTDFVHGERFSGLIVGYDARDAHRYRGRFNAMNLALKECAET